LKTLRKVVAGAEKCPVKVYETVARRWPQLAIFEGYGITECSPVISVNDENDPRPGSIGKALPSVEYAIRAVEGGGRVAAGQPGMLLVRGPSVFAGYLHYDGPTPFEEFEGKSWYCTGDLVREEPDGVLTFAGRLKRFVKLGGEMISLPAIEEALVNGLAAGADQEGPVLAVEATPVETNPDLVLFTVLDISRDDANQAIRKAGLSPLHNIRHVRRVEEIPTLGTGKTDYRALRGLLKE
jgi:long-chain-fatty-acid--[acyl-carrier-protein] ligase